MQTALYIALLAAVLICACAGSARSWRSCALLIGLVLVSFFARVFLGLFNNEVGFIAEKAASDTSANLFLQLIGWLDGAESMPRLRSSFFVQTLINTPGYLLAGTGIRTTLITNAFLGAFVAIPAYAYLRRVGPRAAAWGALLFVTYPAGVNFSLFGLRDIAIYLLVSVHVLAVVSWALPNRRAGRDALIAVTSAILTLWQRPELLPIVAVFPALLMMRGVWRLIDQDRTRAGRVLLRTASALVALGAGFLLADIGMRFVARQIGAESLTIADVASIYAVERMDRSTQEGHHDESNILPSGAYVRMNPVERTALQIGGMIVLPYPWLITDSARAMAAVDSVVLIGLLVVALRYARRTRQQVLLFSLATFSVGIFLMGLIVANAGNAFRMRLALVPYVLMVAAVALGHANNTSSDVPSSDASAAGIPLTPAAPHV